MITRTDRREVPTPPKPVYEMTQKQWADWRVRSVAAYYNRTQADIRRMYEKKYLDEYYEKIEEAAAQGVRIPDKTLDRLEHGFREHLLKHYGKYDWDWFPPDIRREMRKARRRRG